MAYYPTIPDVSHHQGRIDWDTAKGYIHFAIPRVQDGTLLDRQLSNNVAACERLGIPYYLYGFYRGGGATEARRMVARAEAAGAGKMLRGYMVDTEVSGFSHDGIRAAFSVLGGTGLKNGHYIANHLWGEYGNDSYGEDWRMVPSYGANDGKAHGGAPRPCDLWQFTSKGTVPGISGGVDLSCLAGEKGIEYFTGEESDMTPEQASQLKFIYDHMRWDDKTHFSDLGNLVAEMPVVYQNAQGKREAQSIGNRIGYMDLHTHVVDVKLEALTEAVKAIAGSAGADPEEIAKAVSDAVAKKLEAIDLTVTVKE